MDLEAGNDAPLCTTHYFSKSTRLFKTRPIGFVQIRSWVITRIQTQRIIFTVHARIGDAQYKLEVEWKIHFYRLRPVDIRPRRRRFQCAGEVICVVVRRPRRWLERFSECSHITRGRLKQAHQQVFCPFPKEGIITPTGV